MKSEVYNEDCMEVMARYHDKYFDLAVVDPPYGIGFSTFNRTNKDSNGNRYKANKYKNGNWDEQIPQHEYFTELIRVSKNQIVWGVITFLAFGNLEVKGLYFGINKTLLQIFQMANWLGLHLTDPQCVLILDIMEVCKGIQVQKAKYTQLKSQYNSMTGYSTTTYPKAVRY